MALMASSPCLQAALAGRSLDRCPPLSLSVWLEKSRLCTWKPDFLRRSSQEKEEQAASAICRPRFREAAVSVALAGHGFSSQDLTEENINRSRRQSVPLEDRFRMHVERNVSRLRLKELGVDSWSSWRTPGACEYWWEWRADEWVYITKGTLHVTPQESEDCAVFEEGDLVRFPKWMLAFLSFQGPFEQRYRFSAYGDP